MTVCHLFDATYPWHVPNMIREFERLFAHRNQGAHHEYVVHGFSQTIGRHYEALKVAGGSNNVTFTCGKAELLRLIARRHRASVVVVHGGMSGFIYMLLLLRLLGIRRLNYVVWSISINNAPTCTFAGLKQVLRRTILRHCCLRMIALTPVDQDVIFRQYGVSTRCIPYPCQYYRVFYETPYLPRMEGPVNVLVGNNASTVNDHPLCFEKLLRFAGNDMRIFCTLTYGNAGNREKIIALGRRKFGDKFTPITEFMSEDAFVSVLRKMDVYVEASRVQNGLFSIYSTIMQGKKVYSRDGGMNHTYLSALGVTAYRISDLDTLSFTEFAEPLPRAIAQANRERLLKHLSDEKIASEWDLVASGAE